ncbi:MAG: hypothetical protein C5B55_04420 [Blastocatellia bacterium]|nr:MAG: hypothetical protein C5B55_04420 [Blastocatellia bacterium]
MKTAIAFIAFGLIAFGPAALIAPESAASLFGVSIHTQESHVYLLAAATRDVVFGAWFLVLLLLRANRRLLSASLLILSLVPLCDGVNVLVHSGPRSLLTLIIHFGSLAILILFGGWLWRKD